MFLSLFVKNCIFASLTLKFSFWPLRWPWVIKIIQEMDCPVKITWKWGITLVPGFICWKIIFDLEIFGGHFVFALEKFRPRVPKWHPADSCSGHPLEPKSIIKHRPYRETRLSKKMPFDNWTRWADVTFAHSHFQHIVMRLWLVGCPVLIGWRIFVNISWRGRDGCRQTPVWWAVGSLRR